MAATNNDLASAFVRIGFTGAASVILADPAKENIDIEALKYFDDKGVKTLCAALRKPGGTIEGPIPIDGTIVPLVPNPGTYVSMKAEVNMTIACYMARHYYRTSRALTATLIMTDRLSRYAVFKEAEEVYKEPTEPLKLTKPDKIMDFIEEWPEHIALYDGQGGRPLAYIIRENVAVPDEATDPAFGEPRTVYTSLRDEIMNRSSHVGSHYAVDSARVFELLNEAVSEHKHVKTWIKPYVATRDGRGAWKAFKAHYRGSSELEAIEVAAEQRLENLQYRGEKQRYNFEMHVSMHRKAQLEIEKATGTLIPETTKVRRLLRSLQAPTMTVPVATIRAQDHLRSSFDASVNYLKTFIATSDIVETRNVSSAITGGKSRASNKKNSKVSGARNKKKFGSSKSLDRYYKPEEWNALDSETRKKVIEARKKRKISQVTSSKSSSDDKKDDDSDISVTQRKSSKKKSNKKSQE
jgi:hypothetical protein